MDTIKITDQVEQYLLGAGYEKKLKHQYHSQDGYYIVSLGKDSYGFDLYSIINKRFDSNSFRGRVISVRQLITILEFVKEDYSLTETELQELNEMKQVANGHNKEN